MEEKDNINQELDNQEEYQEEKVSISDRIEDALDTVQDVMYGTKGDPNEDIIPTIELDSGRRKVNKVQLRRNMYRKIFGKKGLIAFLIIMGIAIVIGLIVSFVG